MFSQLITPFIIATDLNGSGRAKKLYKICFSQILFL